MNSRSRLLWYDSKDFSEAKSYKTTDALESVLLSLKFVKSEFKSNNAPQPPNKSKLEHSTHDQLIPVFNKEQQDDLLLLRDAKAEKLLQLEYRLEQLELRLDRLEEKVSCLSETYSSLASNSTQVSRESNYMNLTDCTSLPAMLFWTMWPVILLTMFNKLRAVNLGKLAQ